MPQILNAVTVIAVTFCLLLSNAEACSPAQRTPQQIYDGADAIIVARAISSKWTSARKPNFFSGIARYIGQLLPHGDSKRSGKTVFKISRVIKGRAKEYMTIRHNVDGSACGVTFNAYDNYLIFVEERKNKYFTGIFGVRPYLSEDGYRELAKIVGVREDDFVKLYQDYLPPEGGG